MSTVTTYMSKRHTMLQFLKGQGLSVRLVAATLMYSVLVAVLVSAIQIYIVYQQGAKMAQESFVQIESGHLPNVTTSLWEVNPAHINVLINGISQLAHVGVVRLTDQHGNHWEKINPHHQIIASKKFPISYREGNDYFQLGVLYVELTNDNILAQLKDRAVGIVITTSLTLLIGSLFVLFLFQRLVTRHLQTMAYFAANLDLHNLDNKLQLHRKQNASADELDFVVNAINKMLDTLRQDLEIREGIENELRAHKEQLEGIVASRTKTLESKSALLEQQTVELEAQNVELNAFAHSVAHDLKTPLTTVLGMSILINSGVMSHSPEKMQHSIAMIHRTATKMGAIIDALLLLASVRRNDEVHVEEVDVRGTAQEACMRLSDLAERYQATINFTENWILALGYQQWVEEVWVNYLSNAIKYGGEAPQIEIGCESKGHVIKFWVSDNGGGILASRQAELFIQFSRLEPEISEGHGLGLSIVKRIIHRLHGEVGYEEATGGGACFWFTLPAAANRSL